jgi:zinc/manganese transport system permease protein
MLALGALFISMSVEYAPETFSLLFGEVLGIAANAVAPTAALAVVCIAAIIWLYRPLMLSSVLADAAEVRGIRARWIELAFLIVVAAATTMTVPVVGALLIFSLMIGPPGAARLLTDEPFRAMAVSVLIALATVWAAIAASYQTNWPVGFFVGTISAAAYALARGWVAIRSGSV